MTAANAGMPLKIVAGRAGHPVKYSCTSGGCGTVRSRRRHLAALSLPLIRPPPPPPPSPLPTVSTHVSPPAHIFTQLRSQHPNPENRQCEHIIRVEGEEDRYVRMCIGIVPSEVDKVYLEPGDRYD